MLAHTPRDQASASRTYSAVQPPCPDFAGLPANVSIAAPKPWSGGAALPVVGNLAMHRALLPSAWPRGVISIIGPGSGLGVASLIRLDDRAHEIAIEVGHMAWACHMHEALAAIEGCVAPSQTDKNLWDAALAGEDSLATSTLDRFCMIFGAVAGDIALEQGASGVVIAGGVDLRLKDYLPASSFGTGLRPSAGSRP